MGLLCTHKKLTPDLERLLFQVVERVGRRAAGKGAETEGKENTVEKREMERIVLKTLYGPRICPWTGPSWRLFSFLRFLLLPLLHARLHPLPP